MWLMLWSAVDFPNKRGERGPCLVLPHRLSLQPDRILSLDGVPPVILCLFPADYD